MRSLEERRQATAAIVLMFMQLINLLDLYKRCRFILTRAEYKDNAEQANGEKAVEADDFLSPNTTDDGGTSSPASPLPQSGSSPSITSTAPIKSRKRSRDDGDISQGVAGMVEAANRLAATFEGPNWGKINAAFEAMPDLDEETAHLAADLFSSNQWMAQYFLSLSEGKRFGWLKMKLNK